MKTANEKLYYMKDYHREFIKVLESINPSRHSYEVFSDWLVMAAAALYSWKKDKDIEEEYAKTAARYTPEALDKHGQLLAITVNALENVISGSSGYDFLGEVFTAAGLGNERNGQFFTPYNVSFMMAKMVFGNAGYYKNRVGKIEEPCCGAGGMLIASAMAIKELEGANYQKDFLYLGRDLDARCCRMAFIQTSLLGLPAVISCGNSLTGEVRWQRETVGYHLADMDFRLRAEALLDLVLNLETKNGKDTETTVNETVMPQSKNFIQGELF
ncbi:MAG: hypothetical protein Pg6C_00540 [Treponemataceae bacterium]|nr:MAG: hypothetical protein Pg6C_00540 [Treponemataceae bacterium]